MNKKRLLKILLFLISILIAMDGIGYLIAWKAIDRKNSELIKAKKKSLQTLRFENESLKKKIEALQPSEFYMIIDTAQNILYLNRGGKTILQAIVSCGSGMILKDPYGKRQWVFETPRGVYSVQSKFEKPLWIKPDWAFIEEGKPIPNSLKERIEAGMLGDYALGFGNGYFIHGTLYTRLLGKNITHGCIRVGDKDLKTIFKTVPIGTKILIF